MRLKPVVLATALLLVSASAAVAAPGRTTTDLNLRSGPGTQYHVIDTMPAGAPVDIENCSGSWCHVDFRGTTGYAAANLLAGTGTTYTYETAPVYEPPYAYDVAPDYFGPDYGFGYGFDDGLGLAYAPGFAFGFGGFHHGFHHHFHHGFHGGHHGFHHGFHGGRHGHHH